MELFEAHHIKPDIRDERCTGHSIDVKFCGQLRPSQQDAVSITAQHDEGILCAPTAFGKTAVAAWLIAARKVNTLVLVHRQQLLDQWHARLAMFLNLPAKLIGQVGRWDCEYYVSAWFDPYHNTGWYATSVRFPRYP